MRTTIAALAFVTACHPSTPSQDTPDASQPSPDAAPDAAKVGTPLGLACSATAQSYTPNPCPAPTAGKATFCFRPGWRGVTAVDVYGGFGQAGDWTAPFLSLAGDGSGTFIGTATLADGTYPYLFRVHGADDNLVRDGMYLEDSENGAFSPPPPKSPIHRSVSVLTIPQTAQPLRHVRGTVVYAGVPQPCFSVALEVGELLNPNHTVLSEHYTGNYVEVGADGTYDFPVADGPISAIIRYPFLLAGPGAPYPDPSTTPSVGIARTSAQVSGADLVLDELDAAYPAADYAAMSPIGGTGALTQTFTFTVIPGAQQASVAVIGTNIAGNDPAYWSAFGTATSLSWNGTFGNGSKPTPGTKYWWGTWQRRTVASTTWTEESLLFPITF
ncbi:MAG: hypothetical protein JWO36_3627 [Myxococcales bacterium]|nr:hypothetical protein [Myxococcales bacterium]